MSAPGDLLATATNPFPMGRIAWSSDGRWIVAAANRNSLDSTVQGPSR